MTRSKPDDRLQSRSLLPGIPRKKIKIRTPDSDWSNNIDLKKVGLDGTLRLEGGYTGAAAAPAAGGDDAGSVLSKKLRMARSQQTLYQHILGITLRYGPSEMRRSELIIVSPAFILSNRSGRVLEIRQATDGPGEGVSGKLSDNDVMPLMSTVYSSGGGGGGGGELSAAPSLEHLAIAQLPQNRP